MTVLGSEAVRKVDPQLGAAMREQPSRGPVELGEALAPLAYGVAIEICDLAAAGPLEEVVAGDDYHSAVAFATRVAGLPQGSRRRARRQRRTACSPIVITPVASGDEVVAELGELGRVALSIP